jgi:hypothetical protein
VAQQSACITTQGDTTERKEKIKRRKRLKRRQRRRRRCNNTPKKLGAEESIVKMGCARGRRWDNSHKSDGRWVKVKEVTGSTGRKGSR